MSVCGHPFFTRLAFAVPAFVSLDGLVALAQHLAVGAALVGTADEHLGCGRHTAGTGMGLMVQEAVGAEKEALALLTWDGGRSSRCGKVAAVGLVATGTFPAWATVVLQVVGVKRFFTFEAKVVFSKEATQQMTYMVMVLDFDQAVVCGRVGEGL